MKCPSSNRHTRRGAFALVLVLVIASVLALVAVGYLSSMSQERATTSAFANKARAEQSAQAGVDTAMGTLKDYFKAFPDSATVWENQSTNSGGTNNDGTTLYLRAVVDAGGNLPNANPDSTDVNAANADFTGGNGPNNVDTSTGVDNRKIFVLPLISGAQPTLLSARTLPTSNTTDYVNLNSRRYVGDTQGWLGTPPSSVYTGTSPKPVWVPWVNIKQQDGVAAGSTAPVIGRYAFWVEDESFRANLSYADGGPTPNNARRDNATNVALDPTDVSLLGLFAFLGDSNPISARTSLLDARGNYPGKVFPESKAVAHATNLNATTADGLRFLTTPYSSALNLTRHGTQRLNLNAVVPPNTSPNDYGAIQTQIDRIVKTIQFHAPNFGQRLYRIAPGTTGAALSSGSVTDPKVLNQMAVTHNSNAATVGDNYAKIYPYKVAANIRDYIDNDSVPTYIMDGGLVYRGGAPSLPPSGSFGDNEVWAAGKDAAPFLTEAASRFRDNGTTTTTFDFFIDYYIEVWNMSTKDVKATDLGPNSFIRVSNPVRWEANNSVLIPKAIAGTPTDVPAYSTGANLISTDADGISPSDSRVNTKRDFKINLSGVTFPAGQVTVITTDADWRNVIKDSEAINHVKQCGWLGTGKSEYKGTFPPSRPAAGKDVANVVFDPSLPNGMATSSSDYETDITIGSDYGYIDSMEGAMPISWNPHITIPKSTSSSYPTFFGGVMRGNWTNTSTASAQGLQASIVGDPRTNNEQLSFIPPNNSSATERTRFNVYDNSAANVTLTPTVNSPSTGIIPTFGLPNYRSVRPNRPENPWPDFAPMYASPNSPTQSELTLSQDKAQMPIANGALTSIGQLGDIFDASRLNDGSTVIGTRGGGRSFKIGQHDDRWDGDSNSASRTWAAWRLVDIFSTTDVMQQRGLININGVNRDNGAALRAALAGYKFQSLPSSTPTQDNYSPTGDTALYNTPANNTAGNLPQLDKLISEMQKRLVPDSNTPATGISQTGTGPFWERGELSELPGFGRTPDVYRPSSLGTAPTYYPQSDLTGSSGPDMSSQVFDRGREEVFRRMVEMVTTRGNVFTVYAIGQALSPDNTKAPLATQQLKVTFRVVPKNKAEANSSTTNFQPAVTYSNFDPNQSTDLYARFAKPDHYEIEVLSVSSSSN